MIAAFLAVVGLAVSTEQPMTFEEYVGTLQCDVNKALRVGDRVDNRIGFQFASLTVGSEDGEDSSIAGAVRGSLPWPSSSRSTQTRAS